MSTSPNGFSRELEVAILAATDAGRVVRDFYDQANARTYEKGDGSLVTDADLASDRVIRALLSRHFPHDPILTEEGRDESHRLTSSRCWIADPIDGTDQFIRRTGDFDVLIALVVDGEPVAAAGYNPATGLLCAAERGTGAWLREGDDQSLRRCRLARVGDGTFPRLATSVWFGAPENAPLVSAIGERMHTAPHDILSIGFSPRIFLPTRPVDAYLGIRLGEDQAIGWEWDFAVADLFIHEAGGRVTDLAGDAHRYNKAHPRNVNGLIAARDPATHQRLLAAVRAEIARLPSL